MGRRLLFVSLLAGAAATRALGQEPTLAVRVVDGETDRAIDDAHCAIVDITRREVRDRFRGGRYTGVCLPRAGDALLVFARGYDLATVALEAGQRSATARLRRCSDRCAVVVPGPVARSRLAVLPSVAGPWGDNPIRTSYEIEMSADRVSIPVPRGMSVFVVVQNRRALVWPGAFFAEAGATVELRMEKARRVRVLRDRELALVEAATMTLPDLLWQPRVDPHRIDAWRSRVLGPGGWLRPQLMAGGETLDVVPDVPFHVFARTREAVVYRYVAPSTETLDLRPPFPLRAVSVRPRVDGRPARERTVLAAGRLDLYTLSTLWDLRDPLRGFCHALPSPDEPWTSPSLPASDWLTLWHPDVGLAHVAWREGEPLEARTYPGRLDVVLAQNVEAEGTVSVYPVWHGSGAYRFAPAGGPLRKRFAGRRVRFPGLCPGRYGVSVAANLRDARTHEPVESIKMTEITIPDDEPHRVLRLPLRLRESPPK